MLDECFIFYFYRFTNLVCRWPGSVHDSFILSQSGLSTKLENKNYAGWLLGDSGYGLKPWLMTPIRHPTTPQESAYNRAQAKTRVVIERVFAVLKSRFRYENDTFESVDSAWYLDNLDQYQSL